MITAIIIDDEQHNRNVLRTLLQSYCSDVNIVDEASNTEEAFAKINKHKPQLIFLDIRMPQKSGFDLLKMFDEIDFEVVFVSAFDEYAIKAFEFNALGYILKPIDFSKLTKTVDKAIAKINSNVNSNGLLHFVKSLSEKTNYITKFSVHHNDKVVFINVFDVASIEANKDFCELKLFDNLRYTSTKDLKMFENVLNVTENFLRINKSVIINTDHIKSYSKGETCVIELKNGQSFEVSRRKKTEILNKLKFI